MSAPASRPLLGGFVKGIDVFDPPPAGARPPVAPTAMVAPPKDRAS